MHTGYHRDIDVIVQRVSSDEDEQERARNIFRALEGMNIIRAQDLLTLCSRTLLLMGIHWD